MEPLYTAVARVTGGRTQGHGRTSGGELDVDLRMPKELGGEDSEGGATNPEQLFAVGYAACFQASLDLVGPRRKAVTGDSTVDARVSLVPTGSGGLRLAIALAVTLPSVPDAEQAAQLLRDAHELCPYSNAIRGNVDVALAVNGAALAA